MPRRLRLSLELLEGRMLLSTTGVSRASVGETLNFVAPGSTKNGVRALVSQQASSVTLILHRGASGLTNIHNTIQVVVTTGPNTNPSAPAPSAAPGVQYQPISKTITFPPGVKSEPVKIPIVAGATNPGMLSFQVTATQLGVLTTSNSYGQATEEVFLAQNISAPVPQINRAYMILSGHRTSDFVLHFSLPMDPASVQNLNAYMISDNTEHDTDGILDLVLPSAWQHYSSSSNPVLKSATYDPSTNTVDLHLAKSVDARDVYQIINSDSDNDTLLDAAGTPINDDGTGLGGNSGNIFKITLGNKKATILDEVTQTAITTTPPRR